MANRYPLIVDSSALAIKELPAGDGLLFADNDKIIIGTGGSDLTLYHDGTNSYITNGTGALKVATETSGIAVTIGHTTSETTVADNLTVTGDFSVGGNFDVTGTLDFSDSAITNVGDIQLDSITGDADSNTAITFSGSDVITISTGGSGRVTIGDGAISPVTDSQIDLGTSVLEFKDAFFDGTVTSDAFAGPLTGDVTGNVSGTSATVTGATQAAITTVANVVTVGTIGTGVWQGTPVATAYIAADAIDGTRLADNAIDSEHYTDGSIDTAHIAASQITNALMADDAIDSAEITDGAIDLAHMSVNSIDSDQYVDGSIDTIHIADDQVTAAKLANTAVTAASYGSSTAIPVVTVDAQGRITAATTAAISSDLTVGADSGTDDVVRVGTDTLDFVGTSNQIATTVSDNQIQIGFPTNVTISGDLIVSGDTTTVNTATLAVEDPLVSLATGNNAADAVDIGIYGLYDTSGSLDLYGGLFRDASDSGKWKLFKDNQAVPTTTVNVSGTGYATGTLVANLEGNVTGNVTGNTSGTAATVTGGTQAAITSAANLATVGTITTGVWSGTALVSAKIGNDQIDSQHYAAASIDNEHLADDAVDSDEIAAGAIDLAHMSVNSIDSDQYVDGSIDTAHIAADQITSALIADDQIDSEHIVDASIDLAHMSVNSIDSDQYVDGSIDTAHIAASNITNALMADDAIGVAELSATGTASSSTFLRGDNAWAAAGAITSYTNSTNNRVLTSVDSTTVNSEANLTFDGSALAVTGAVNSTGEMRITNPSATSQLYLYGASGQKSNIVLNEYGVRAWHIGAGTSISGDLSIWDSTNARIHIKGDGKVGIGTTSPDSLLSVTSTGAANEDVLYLKSGADNTDEYIGLAFETAGGGNGPHGAIRVYNGPSANDSYLSLLTTTDGGTLTQGLVQDHLGNIGIGTESPGHRLVVKNASAGATQMKIQTGAGNTANAYGGLLIGGEATNAKAGMFLVSRGDSWSRGDLVFAVDNTTDSGDAVLADERMRITREGLVHVGNAGTISGNNLRMSIGDGSGSNTLAIYSGASSWSSIYFTDETSNPYRGVIQYNHSDNNLQFYSNTAERLRFASNGAWGIQGANYGSDGQVLTSAGTGAPPAWETVSGGGGGGVTYKQEGTNFTTSLLVGHSTTGTLSGATACTGVGISALDALTSGDNNTGVGALAGGAISSGHNNTVVGAYALKNNATGSANTSLGYAAGMEITADNQTAVGYYALAQNVSNSSMTAVGYQALRYITSGNDAVGVGANTLSSSSNTAANGNHAFGFNCFHGVTTGGDGLVAVGRQAGSAQTTADQSVFVGKSAGWGANTGQSVGIGRRALQGVTTGNANTAIGFQTMYSGPGTGGSNTYVGAYCGNTTSGSNNFGLGYQAAYSGSPGGQPAGNNEGYLGDENITTINAQVGITAASDKRDKNDIEPLTLGLEFINKLEPVTYRWDKRVKYIKKYQLDLEPGEDGYVDLDDVEHDGTHTEPQLNAGLLAQDVEEIEQSYGFDKKDLTALVTNLSGDGKAYSLQYERFVPMLIKSVQELSSQVENLKEEIEELKND